MAVSFVKSSNVGHFVKIAGNVNCQYVCRPTKSRHMWPHMVEECKEIVRSDSSMKADFDLEENIIAFKKLGQRFANNRLHHFRLDAKQQDRALVLGW